MEDAVKVRTSESLPGFAVSTIVTPTRFETRVFNKEGDKIPAPLLYELKQLAEDGIFSGTSFPLSDGAGFETFSFDDMSIAHEAATTAILRFAKNYSRKVIYVHNDAGSHSNR